MSSRTQRPREYIIADFEAAYQLTEDDKKFWYDQGYRDQISNKLQLELLSDIRDLLQEITAMSH